MEIYLITTARKVDIPKQSSLRIGGIGYLGLKGLVFHNYEKEARFYNPYINRRVRMAVLYSNPEDRLSKLTCLPLSSI